MGRLRVRVSGIARDTGWQGLSELVNLVTGFVLLNVLIRFLGPAGYGRYAAIMALAYILVTLSSVWVVMVLLQQTIQSRRDLPAAFGAALGLAVPAAVLAFAAGLAIGPLLLPAIPMTVVAGFVAAELVGGVLIQVSAGAVQLAHGLPAAVRVRLLQTVARFVVIMALALLGEFTLASLAFWLFLTYVVLGLVIFLVTTSRLGLRRLPSRPRMGDIRDGMPYAGTLVSLAVQEDSDKLFLVRFADPVAAGLYAAAYRIVQLGFLPIKAIIGSSHPRFLVSTPGVRNEHLQRALRYTWPTATYALVATIGVIVLAPVVPAVFGPEYEGTLPLLMALAPLLLLRSLSLFPLNALMGLARHALRFYVILGAAVANVLLNVALIPTYGVWGAIGSTLGTEVAFVALVWTYVVVAQRRHDRGLQSWRRDPEPPDTTAHREGG